MSFVVNVQEAKTGLSKILRRVEAGEEVVIARDGVPIVRLVPIDEPAPRPVGFVQGSVTSDFFEPLPEEELARWR
jgi:prevent-host-death family protein